MRSLSDANKPDSKYLCSLVTNLIEEWKQVSDSEGHSRDKRQLSDQVVSSKKSFENTLERVRRSTKIEGKGNIKETPVPVVPPQQICNNTGDKTPALYLSIPDDSPQRAPTLPPRNNLTRGNVIKDKRIPLRKDQLLKASSSCCDLGISSVTPPPRVKNSQTQRESVITKNSLEPTDTPSLLLHSHDSHLQSNSNLKCLTPEPFRRPGISLPDSPQLTTGDTSPPRIKTARSCDDILGISCEDIPGESTLLSNSLRSSYVKFKTRNGKWGKMYITMVGKNIYVSRNYADDQTELVYSLEELDILPKNEGRSKYLIQLKSHNCTQCSISIKSEEIRDDWYKAMVRSKYKPKSKSSVNSVEVSPTEHAPERSKKRDQGIYVSPNSVDPSAARDLGIKVVITNGTVNGNGNGTKGCVEREGETAESEYLELKQELETSGDYVIRSLDEKVIEKLNVSSDKKIEDHYLPLNDFTPFLYNGSGVKECQLSNGDNTCEERNYYYLQN